MPARPPCQTDGCGSKIGMGASLPAALARGLLLIIRAQLEALRSGITTLENEFLTNIVLPDGGTVGQWLEPHVEEAYATWKILPILEAGIPS